MTQLATIARQQAAQAAESETRLTKSIRWGVRVLQRSEDANAMRVVFSHWRCACPAASCNNYGPLMKSIRLMLTASSSLI